MKVDKMDENGYKRMKLDESGLKGITEKKKNGLKWMKVNDSG